MALSIQRRVQILWLLFPRRMGSRHRCQVLLCVQKRFHPYQSPQVQMIGSRRSFHDALLGVEGIEGLLKYGKKMGRNLDSGAMMSNNGATHRDFQPLVCISYQGVYLEHRKLLCSAFLITKFWRGAIKCISNKLLGGAEAAGSTLRTLNLSKSFPYRLSKNNHCSEVSQNTGKMAGRGSKWCLLAQLEAAAHH